MIKYTFLHTESGVANAVCRDSLQESFRGGQMAVFKCNLHYAKKKFYRSAKTANAIFVRIGVICSEEVLLQLIDSKCLPMLIYGMEVCPLGKSDLRALDFVVDRFFMKLFQTSNIEVARLAQRMFGFALPSFLIEKT